MTAATPGPSDAPRGPRRVALPPPGPVRSLAALKRQLAERLLDMHPDEIYRHAAPFQVLAAPVLLIEAKPDGSLRRIEVLRTPHAAKDTLQLAIDAVRRAFPLGAARDLPGPLAWTETFLFDEKRRFKPRSLE